MASGQTGGKRGEMCNHPRTSMAGRAGGVTRPANQGEGNMDILNELKNVYNLPIWGLYRLIWALADEIVKLRRQLAAQAGEKAA